EKSRPNVASETLIFLPPATASCIVISSIRLHGRPYRDVTAGCTGNIAFHQQQIALFVNADHLEVLCGDTLHTHVSGHLLALEYTARRLVLANGTGNAMRNGIAMRRVLHPEVVT